MNPAEEVVADLWSTGIAADGHPTQFLRAQLDADGVLRPPPYATPSREAVSRWPASSPIASAR